MVFQVGHLERFNPAILAVRDQITRPLFIESDRLAVFKPRGIDVNVVLDLMIHDIDLILSFARSDITAVRASGFPVLTAAVDIANARIEFADGCVADVSASRVSQTVAAQAAHLPARPVHLHRLRELPRAQRAQGGRGPGPGGHAADRCRRSSSSRRPIR